jgi:sugar (pentulose or hexulose) kinase
MVTTPSGRPVAMVHCNNGASELDAWMRMFGEILSAVGAEVSGGELYGKLFNESLKGAADCDDVTLFNYISGEPVTGLNDGRPLLVRRKDSKLSLANFMRSQIYSIFASLAVGHRILDAEQVRIRRLTGHGGLFKTPGVAQKYMAAALNAPVTVMKTAGEGGPYGMALLAAYLLKAKEISLEEYLENVVFGDAEGSTMEPDAADVAGYKAYLKAYCDALDLEHTAVKCVK